MKKLLALILLFFINLPAFAVLKEDGINIFNLRENNAYLLNLTDKVENIDNTAEQDLRITPVTSLLNDNKQLVIEANKTGVFDVTLRTSENVYKIRFVTGTQFQSETDELCLLDIPESYSGGEK